MSYSSVRLLRRARRALKRADLRLRGVSIDSTAVIDPAAVFEPSGGQISIGAGVAIDRGVILRPLGGFITISGDSSINAYSVIYGAGGLLIGQRTRIGAHVIIIPSNHIFDDPEVPIMLQGLSLKGIVIGDDVWIGAGARILDGVEIGDGAVVGAGAVVTKSVRPGTVVAGVPARQISVR